jgi:DMSO/TMAO reductase YedYZ molybdopterin-dependent catalytic subunit
MPLTPRAFGWDPTRPRRRAEKQGIDPARLPPGQSPTAPGKFPVLTVGPAPHVAPGDWKLFIHGEVAEPLSFSLADLRPRALEQVCDVHCVTRWSKFDTRWTGVRVRELLEAARPKPEATHALVHSYGGYSTNLPLEALLDDDVLVTWAFDGQPLEHQHGGPVRLLVPKRYFWKSAKYLQAIELLDHDEPGFWERNGYHNEGDPWLEERTHTDPFAFRALRRRARGVKE